MGEKGVFARDVARLAKYWSQTILFDGKVAGMSLIFELIAVKAAIEEEAEARKRKQGGSSSSPSAPTFVGAFKKFLEKVANLRRERIVFAERYRPADVPPEVAAQTPLLVNPVNRYQNMLDQAPAEFFDVFAKCANQSLVRLANLSGPNRYPLDASTKLADLFKAQPLLYQYENRKFMPANHLVSTGSWAGDLPKESANRDVWTDFDRQRQFAKILLVNLSSQMEAQMFAKPKASPSEIKNLGEKMIDTAVGRVLNWAPTNEKHESRKFTFHIPTGSGQALLYSFN